MVLINLRPPDAEYDQEKISHMFLLFTQFEKIIWVPVTYVIFSLTQFMVMLRVFFSFRKTNKYPSGAGEVTTEVASTSLAMSKKTAERAAQVAEDVVQVQETAEKVKADKIRELK